MNRIESVLKSKSKAILNIFFTAGYPTIEDLPNILKDLKAADVDLIEIGMPYSDPLADGKTIQSSSEIALRNGMNLKLLFKRLDLLNLKEYPPIILMGYLNQMMQFGEEAFIKQAKSCGVSGLIIPDLPMDIYEENYAKLFVENEMAISFLISPQTSEKRILQASRLSTGFVYVVSQSSITGQKISSNEAQIKYFEKIKAMELVCPTLIGFGINDRKSFEKASKYADGAIIGSAFIKAIQNYSSSKEVVEEFISKIR